MSEQQQQQHPGGDRKQRDKQGKRVKRRRIGIMDPSLFVGTQSHEIAIDQEPAATDAGTNGAEKNHTTMNSSSATAADAAAGGGVTDAKENRNSSDHTEDTNNNTNAVIDAIYSHHDSGDGSSSECSIDWGDEEWIMDKLDQDICNAEEDELMQSLDDEIAAREEEELMEELLESVRAAEDMERFKSSPSQVTVFYSDMDDEPQQVWSVQLQNRTLPPPVPQSHEQASESKVCNISEPEKICKFSYPLPKYKPAAETDLEGQKDSSLLFTRSDFQACVIDPFENLSMPRVNNNLYRPTKAFLNVPNSQSTSRWSVRLKDNPTNPMTYIMEASIPVTMEEQLRDYVENFIRSAVNANNLKNILNDPESIVVDLDIKIDDIDKKGLGAKFRGPKASTTTLPSFANRNGVWIVSFKENGLLYSKLGGSHMTEHGAGVIEVNGQSVSRGEEIKTIIDEARRNYQRAKREKHEGTQCNGAIKFRLVFPRYVDFLRSKRKTDWISREEKKMIARKLTVSRLDGATFDRENREHHCEVRFDRAIESAAKPVLPPLWVEYDSNLVRPRDKAIFSKVPRTKNECLEAYTFIMNDEGSVEADILIQSSSFDALGVKMFEFEHGLYLYDITESSPFTKAIGQKATFRGFVIRSIGGLALGSSTEEPINFKDDIEARKEINLLFGVKIALSDGTDFSGIDRSCLYRHGYRTSLGQTEIADYKNPRRLKRPNEAYPLCLRPQDVQNDSTNSKINRNKNTIEGEAMISHGQVISSTRTAKLSHGHGESNATVDDVDEFELTPSRSKVNDAGSDGANRRTGTETNAVYLSHGRFESSSTDDNVDEFCFVPTSDEPIDAGYDDENSETRTKSAKATSDAKKADQYVSYSNFRSRYKALVDINYKDCGMKHQAIYSSMWQQHKTIFKNGICDDKCNCLFVTNQLVENVFQGNEAARDKSANIFELFADRFVHKLRQEYPTENADQLLDRLAFIWTLHQRIYGPKCGNNCNCESEWDQQFGKGSEQLAQNFLTGKKRPHVATVDTNEKPAKVPRKKQGSAEGSHAATSSVTNRHEVQRSSNANTFEKTFETDTPLGAFFRTKTVANNSTCRVCSINDNAVFAHDDRIKINTIVIAVDKADKRIPIENAAQLKQHYDDSKRKRKKICLVFHNQNFADHSPEYDEDYWDDNGNWMGPPTLIGWAGGASQPSITTMNETGNVHADSLKPAAQNQRLDGSVASGLGVSKKDALMTATRGGSVEHLASVLQSMDSKELPEIYSVLTHEYAFCDTEFKRAQVPEKRMAFATKRGLLKTFIDGISTIERGIFLPNWATISFRNLRLHIDEKASAMWQSFSKVHAVIETQIVAAETVGATIAVLQLRNTSQSVFCTSPNEQVSVNNNAKLNAEQRILVIKIVNDYGATSPHGRSNTPLASFNIRLNELEMNSTKSWSLFSQNFERVESSTHASAVVKMDVRREHMDKRHVQEKSTDVESKIRSSIEAIQKIQPTVTKSSILRSIQSFNGSTMLHAAVKVVGVPIKLIQQLLQLGADPKQTNIVGDTALSLARVHADRTREKLDELKKRKNATEQELQLRKELSNKAQCILMLLQKNCE